MKDKSVLLIGNGGSLLDSNLGKKIDEFDEVIRINEAKTKGWEKDVGTKFTIWCTYNPNKKFNKFLEGYKNRNYSMDKIWDIVKGINEIWYVAPRMDLLNVWVTETTKKLHLDDRIIRYESIPTMRKINKLIPKATTTTGFILINILTMMYDHIYIVGFDFIGLREPIKYHHYFSTGNPTDIHKDTVHQLADEMEYTNNLIDEGKVIYLTKDTKIKKSKYIYKDILQYTCNNCGRINYLYDWENRLCHYCEKILK